jgi:hypothetical protein
MNAMIAEKNIILCILTTFFSVEEKAALKNKINPKNKTAIKVPDS